MIRVNETTRAGRMISAGRVTVTFRSPSGQHITLTAHCKAPNADGQWSHSSLASAKVIWIEVPNQSGFGDKVGKITKSKGFVSASGADPARVYCVAQLIKFLAGEPTKEGLEIFEESKCGHCGRPLTDPVSIERGIGPDCNEQLTGSKHQSKSNLQAIVAGTAKAGPGDLPGPAEMQKIGEIIQEHVTYVRDSKGRMVPKTFSELAKGLGR